MHLASHIINVLAFVLTKVISARFNIIKVPTAPYREKTVLLCLTATENRMWVFKIFMIISTPIYEQNSVYQNLRKAAGRA